MGAGSTKPFNIKDVDTDDGKHISVTHRQAPGELAGLTTYTFDSGNYIVGGLQVKDANYARVSVLIGVDPVEMKLKDGVWQFTDRIPIFMLSDDKCVVEILGRAELGDVDIEYDRYNISTATRKSMLRRAVTSGNLLYSASSPSVDAKPRQSMGVL